MSVDHPEVLDEELPNTLRGELHELGLFGQAWTLTVVVFCVLRAVAVWPMLLDHGVNPWWFLVLDVGTAPTYGLGQAMGVKMIRDERRPMTDKVDSHTSGTLSDVDRKGGPQPVLRRCTHGPVAGLADALHLGGNGLVPQADAHAIRQLLDRGGWELR